MEAETLFAVIGISTGLGAAAVAWFGSRMAQVRRTERLAAVNDDLMAMLRTVADVQVGRPVPTRRTARRSSRQA